MCMFMKRETMGIGIETLEYVFYSDDYNCWKGFTS